MESTDSTTTPNAARVYDYMLGGNHNFEPDRQAAAYMAELVPSTAAWVRRLRHFLHEAVIQLADEGFDRFLDLASGLPTEDHIHATVPYARVIYVDNDPLVVSYGTELLGKNPNVRYLAADIRDVASLLDAPAVKELLGGATRVAIGLNAVTCFLTDNDIRHIVRTLYDWSPSGSKLFASFETKDPALMTPRMQKLVDMFEQMGSPYHFLTLEQSQELMKPWTADGNGFRPMGEILGPHAHVSAEDREGVNLEFYGAILVK